MSEGEGLLRNRLCYFSLFCIIFEVGEGVKILYELLKISIQSSASLKLSKHCAVAETWLNNKQVPIQKTLHTICRTEETVVSPGVMLCVAGLPADVF